MSLEIAPPSRLAASQPELALRSGLARARSRGEVAWVSWSERLGELPDLFELFQTAEQQGERRFLMSGGEPSQTLLGVGLAGELAFEDATAGIDQTAKWFGRVEFEGGSGELGPLLLGGLAFAPATDRVRDPIWRPFGNARFALPEFLFSEGALIVSVRVAPDDDEDALLRRVAVRRALLLEKPTAAERVEVSLALPAGDDLSHRYATTAARLIDAIRAGGARKVVLAEQERIPVAGRLPALPILRALAEAHPSCTVYAMGIGERTFLGVTPECLVAVRGGRVRAAAVGGTSNRVRDPLADALRHSRKERAEHDFVVRGIETSMRPFCASVEVPSEPTGLGAGRAQHLWTELCGTLRAPTHVLELVAALHPTAAVAGTPRDRALELICEHEQFDRGWYAGPIGWMDRTGQGEFQVALRCGLLTPGEIRLYAGAGLVEASDPAREADEVQLKLLALRDALVRACGS